MNKIMRIQLTDAIEENIPLTDSHKENYIRLLEFASKYDLNESYIAYLFLRYEEAMTPSPNPLPFQVNYNLNRISKQSQNSVQKSSYVRSYKGSYSGRMAEQSRERTIRTLFQFFGENRREFDGRGINFDKMNNSFLVDNKFLIVALLKKK